MNWTKLHTDYPKAYKHMENNFKCLYTIKMFDGELVSNYSDVLPLPKGEFVTDKSCTIIHPLKRDLYDFFDSEGIVIGISNIGVECEFPFSWEIDIDYVGGISTMGNKTRSQAETEAFIKAFKILNDRL